jgi:hypothetical protein
MDDEIAREECIISIVVVMACAPVVTATALEHVAFDGGSSLCLVFGAVALCGLVRRWRAMLVVIALAIPCLAYADDPSVTLGGYIETYYSLNFRLPSNHITNLRGFDDRERTFTLSNVALGATAERGPLRSRIMLQFGSTPSTYYSAADASTWKYVQQATLAYTPSKLVVEAGLFTSPIGPEPLAIKDNWNWSRSNLFFGLPAYHAGARASYPLGGGWIGTLHAYTGWNSVVDNNSYPSIAASAAYASDRVSGQLLYFGGVERSPGAPEGNAWRNLFDAYATLGVSEQTSLQAQLDTGIEPNDLGTNAWFAAALYGKVKLSSKLFAAARADYFREWATDAATPLFWPSPWIASATTTFAVAPIDGLSVRIELRHDQAKTPAYFGGSVAGDGTPVLPYVPNRRAQETLTVGATAWF